MDFNRKEGLSKILEMYDNTSGNHQMEYVEEIYLKAVEKIEKLQKENEELRVQIQNKQILLDIYRKANEELKELLNKSSNGFGQII